MVADFKDAVKSGLNEYYEALKGKLDGLTEAELRWQPTLESNHIQWTVFHMARVVDRWIQQVMRGEQQLWHRDRWFERLGLAEDAHGRGDTPDTVREMPALNIADVLAYYDATQQATLDHIDDMTPEDLERTYNARSRRGGVTGAWILGHLIVEESQHLGQIAYIRGMIRGFNG